MRHRCRPGACQSRQVAGCWRPSLARLQAVCAPDVSIRAARAAPATCCWQLLSGRGADQAAGGRGRPAARPRAGMRPARRQLDQFQLNSPGRPPGRGLSANKSAGLGPVVVLVVVVVAVVSVCVSVSLYRHRALAPWHRLLVSWKRATSAQALRRES